MHRSWQIIAVQMLAGAAIVVLLFFTVDIEDVKTVFRDAEYVWVLIAFPLFLVANLIGSFRSRLSLQRMGEVPVTPLFQTYLVGFMANSVIPLRIGDLLRIQVISRRYGLPVSGVTSAVFITETLFDGAAFTLLFLWTLAFFGIPGVLLSLAWTLSAVILAAVIVAAVFARVELEDGWVDRNVAIRWLPERVRGLVGRLLPEALQGLALLADWLQGARAFLLTLLGWIVQAAMYWTFGQAFGLDLSLADSILVMMTASFIVSAHFIPTSIGIYEGGITGLLVILGYTGGEALAFSVGTHVLMIVFGVFAGLVAMWRLRLGLNDLVAMGQRGVEQTEEMLAIGETQDQEAPVR
jgi:uncharacterized membrane protein YbhN (UPF0104 family)